MLTGAYGALTVYSPGATTAGQASIGGDGNNLATIAGYPLGNNSHHTYLASNAGMAPFASPLWPTLPPPPTPRSRPCGAWLGLGLGLGLG